VEKLLLIDNYKSRECSFLPRLVYDSQDQNSPHYMGALVEDYVNVKDLLSTPIVKAENIVPQFGGIS
jgi:hypothetical protein